MAINGGLLPGPTDKVPPLLPPIFLTLALKPSTPCNKASPPMTVANMLSSDDHEGSQSLCFFCTMLNTSLPLAISYTNILGEPSGMSLVMTYNSQMYVSRLISRRGTNVSLIAWGEVQPERMVAVTTVSISAEGCTKWKFLPPHSPIKRGKLMYLSILLPTCFHKRLKVLNLIPAKWGEAVMVSPNTGPSAGTKLTTPSGTPASRIILKIRQFDNTAVSEGFHKTALP
ncbi:hypothetical protein FF38_09305 [Lucilia cuprina]|uniref:Uncharacterized protein n=1 Tax=Lucilia cuprina TaxID=7375 RepID=A0A0L0CFA0_LUCCU|nr:hypothetical protein FF38_09305 [Lucilia cuprina]